ncbi:diadenylate cyclase, partial [Patescibacteria group bacterium]|nr:diadenylate cyclase [Patescibacteria group bacterium]
MQKNNTDNKEINNQKKPKQQGSLNKKRDFVDVLKIFSPGTAIRSALDSILRAEIGALIVVDIENLSKIMERGFRVNSKFSPQKIVELSKMDGAIILSKDLKQILSANTLIFPDVKILTKETGARHTVAERTAKQMNTIVIAISKRKKKITIYFGELKYELEKSSEVLRRAAETLQILE